MLVGCTLSLISSLARLSSSAARMTTEVVPSPTSASCSCASCTSRLAVGCSTSNFLRMVAPSLVIVTSPMSSTIILSSPCGPREDLTMLATDKAARTTLPKEYRCRLARPCPKISILRCSRLLTLFYDLNIFKSRYITTPHSPKHTTRDSAESIRIGRSKKRVGCLEYGMTGEKERRKGLDSERFC